MFVQGMMDAGDDLSDYALVERIIRSGDVAAFELLYERHSRAAYGLACSISGSPGAEAVVQEAFLLVWRQIATYRPDCGSVRAWLLSVVHHHAISTVRRQAQRPHPLNLIPCLLDAVGMAEPARPDSVRQEMHALLDRLSPDQQRAVILAYFGGYTHGDIARILELSPGMVKREICQGLQILHSQLT